MLANDSVPIIEVKADRTMIYPQRMDNCPLNGDTRLILSQMEAKDIAKSGRIMFWEDQRTLPWGEVQTEKIQFLKQETK